MTRRNILHFVLGGALTAAFLTTSAGSAFAQSPPSEDVKRSNLRKEILIRSQEAPREEAGWLAPNFQLHEKSGFSYTRRLKIAEKPFVFRIQGPVLRRQEALGIAFKIRF